MNKELTNLTTESQNAFTVELGKAVDDILNHLSNGELDNLLNGEDRTFLNQMTPDGELLVRSTGDQAATVRLYSWGSFTLAVGTCVATSIVAVNRQDSDSEWAANRHDLALAA